MLKLKPIDLRTTVPTHEHVEAVKRNAVYIIVDNVLDTYNVGAIFRLADAVAVTKVMLCRQTEIPPHTRIKKASINTTEWVPWEYHENTIDAITKLRQDVKEIQIVAVELDKRSIPYDIFPFEFPIALVVGHETNGVSEDVLSVVDGIVELPMWGVNVSLNVMVSLGIVLYKVMEQVAKSSHT